MSEPRFWHGLKEKAECSGPWRERKGGGNERVVEVGASVNYTSAIVSMGTLSQQQLYGAMIFKKKDPILLLFTK